MVASDVFDLLAAACVGCAPWIVGVPIESTFVGGRRGSGVGR